MSENEIKHDEHCRYNEQKAIYDRWYDEHPQACRKCGGWGLIYTQYDPSPAGGGLAPGYLEDVDLCECLENDTCPVCGQIELEWRNDDMNCKCSRCGYDDEHPQKTAAPPEPECYCWERELDEQMEEWGL